MTAPRADVLPDDAPLCEVWAEVFRLRAAVQGPDGYATWQDAATAERIRRVKDCAALRAERDALAEALESAHDALREIALAGMSPSPEMSSEGIDAWHARQAWRFIGIAARALPITKASTAIPKEPTK